MCAGSQFSPLLRVSAELQPLRPHTTSLMVVSNGEFFGLSRARQSRIAADTIRRVKSRHALARCEIDIASGLGPRRFPGSSSFVYVSDDSLSVASIWNALCRCHVDLHRPVRLKSFSWRSKRSLLTLLLTDPWQSTLRVHHSL